MSSWNVVQRKVTILHLGLNSTPETWTITWKFYKEQQEALMYMLSLPKKSYKMDFLKYVIILKYRW